MRHAFALGIVYSVGKVYLMGKKGRLCGGQGDYWSLTGRNELDCSDARGVRTVCVSRRRTFIAFGVDTILVMYVSTAFTTSMMSGSCCGERTDRYGMSPGGNTKGAFKTRASFPSYDMWI